MNLSKNWDLRVDPAVFKALKGLVQRDAETINLYRGSTSINQKYTITNFLYEVELHKLVSRLVFDV